MKIVFLYLLINIYQYSDATVAGDDCGSLKDIQDKQPTVVKAGSAIELATPDRSACRHGNASYVLLHQNQKSGKLQRLYDQKEYRVETPPIYLNISGVYCVYKQCGAVQMDQCCIKATVMEMQIIFSESVSLDTVEYGSCYVSKWPRPPIDSVAVTTNNGNCKIKTLSVRFIDAYTTAVFFMIQVNSFCNRVTCFEPSRQEDRAINISHFTDSPPSTPPNGTSKFGDLPCKEGNTSTISNSHQSGVLGVYRITLWIIVLTLTVLSITI